MNGNEFGQFLKRLRACDEAKEWAHGKSFEEVWTTCERGDWLLWLCGRMVNKPGWPTRQQVVIAACACAEPALKFVKQGEDRPRVAIETAQRWARGEAMLTEVRAAAAAASAAYADADAYASAAAAAAAAHRQSRFASLKLSADLVRAHIKMPQGEEGKQRNGTNSDSGEAGAVESVERTESNSGE